MRMLIVSDSHVPDRAPDIPQEIKSYVRSNGPFDVVIHAGDLTCREVFEFFSVLGKRFIAVAGNMDWLPLDEYEVVDLGYLRLGVVHGDQVYPRGNKVKLAKIARRLGVEVLVYGHTHSASLDVVEGVVLINPGSVTGVPSGGGITEKPSFMIMDVNDAGGGIVFAVSLYRMDVDSNEIRIENRWLLPISLRR